MASWSFRELFWRYDQKPTSEVSTPSSVPKAIAPTILQGLRDVPGVIGSVAVGLDGGIVDRDLPPQLDAVTSERLAARLSQLRDALVSEGDSFEAVQLRYQDYHLHVTAAQQALVGVLTTDAVNLPALSMAMKLVGRKFSTLRSSAGAP